MDYGLWFLILGVLAILVPAIYAGPKFIMDILDLRKRWRTEFPPKPPKTIREMWKGLDQREIEQPRLRNTFWLFTIRAGIAVFDIVLVTVLAAYAGAGHPVPAIEWVVVDAYLMAMAIFGVYVIRRGRHMLALLIILRRLKEEQGVDALAEVVAR